MNPNPPLSLYAEGHKGLVSGTNCHFCSGSLHSAGSPLSGGMVLQGVMLAESGLTDEDRNVGIVSNMDKN